ncbi:hypothetical protein H696_05076 [Fonticula alba]|uniref:VDE lipocalin domain-containing protein n=1 Tax=Fonticula alba TaxID=691883 RepID=A0A058Z3Q9_FONAL|nr:hypothetical protein H696_05076 [Fonticula alba]KCV68157.1 hypothetical protein H696_05076 [Fonticula alba]|eukprot:XP_009497211.1 hypothetical protein H696_05076 [Fonticula alba]
MFSSKSTRVAMILVASYVLMAGAASAAAAGRCEGRDLLYPTTTDELNEFCSEASDCSEKCILARNAFHYCSEESETDCLSQMTRLVVDCRRVAPASFGASLQRVCFDPQSGPDGDGDGPDAPSSGPDSSLDLEHPGNGDFCPVSGVEKHCHESDLDCSRACAQAIEPYYFCYLGQDKCHLAMEIYIAQCQDAQPSSFAAGLERYCNEAPGGLATWRAGAMAVAAVLSILLALL